MSEHSLPMMSASVFLMRDAVREAAVLASYIAAVVGQHAMAAALADLEPSVRSLKSATEGVCRNFREAEAAEIAHREVANA